MKLTREEVLRIARLARVGVTESDVQSMQEQLSNILDNFEILREVNTDGVPPTSQSVELHNVTRDDDIKPSLSQDNVLANAPKREGAFFKVNAVLED